MATSVQFTDTSTGIISAWLWDFGDGSPPSVLQNPLHNYAVDGTYTVTLDVFNPYGGVDSISEIISVPAASFTVNITAPGQTLTINSLGVSAPTIVDWGDTLQDTYSGTTLRTHVYAGIGVYTVKILNPSRVITFDIRDNKVTLNSADVVSLVNLQTFIATTLKAGTFNSADVSAWRPAFFGLTFMPAGYAGTFNSADVSAWRPTSFQLTNMPAGYAGTFNSADVSAWRPAAFGLTFMPAGYAGTFNSADVSAWRPTTLNLFSMPAGYAGTMNCGDFSNWNPTTFNLFSLPVATTVFIIPANSFSSWLAATLFRMSSNGLTQPQVDQILFDFYAAFVLRPVNAGSINVGGALNAAPSGILQAMCPPVTGKENAFELVNDSCLINPTKKWATVTITP